MRQFPVKFEGEQGSVIAIANKLPGRGAWLDLGDGDSAKVVGVHHLGSEKVIVAQRQQGPPPASVRIVIETRRT